MIVLKIDEKQIFNLWNTNGRRSDVLNALSIYLSILEDLGNENPGDKWSSYPKSFMQYEFYVRAIEASPEVFSKHEKYDAFKEKIKPLWDLFLNNDPAFFEDKRSDKLIRILDKDIEQRARHYTSNLVRIGFATQERVITPSGQAFLNNIVNRDRIEKILPIKNTNLLLLRQLMKLRIFTKDENGICKYYSPFYMALYLLLTNETIDKSSFINIVQGASPSLNEDIKNKLLDDDLEFSTKENLATSLNVNIVDAFKSKDIISETEFSRYIKNRKSGKTEKIYYEFYKTLYQFIDSPSTDTYKQLNSVYMNNSDKIKKAFCRGKSIFDFGTNGVYNLNEFKLKNKENPFLITDKFNEFFYEMYENSKYLDQIAEYSDTTIRMFGATGVIKTKAPLYELSYKHILKDFFEIKRLKEMIFGEISSDEYIDYELSENSFFGSIKSMTQIFEVSDEKTTNIMKHLFYSYGVKDLNDLALVIDSETSRMFEKHIEDNYPLERVVNLLKLFSDRSQNDRIIKREVNEAADVPTIYEYLIGIAWYYISNKNFNLYDSFNLTLNADFEPMMHAGGGVGDIIVDYDDKSVMLEVTLMNKAAQKRAEWEPVLRHSINNRVEKLPRKSYTFFIADELDFNTINIWRAVAAVPLQATISDSIVDGVIIMPFTNNEIISFLEKNINSKSIIEQTELSFSKINKITNDGWRQDIIEKL